MCLQLWPTGQEQCPRPERACRRCRIRIWPRPNRVWARCPKPRRRAGRADRTRPNAPCRAGNSPTPADKSFPRPRARCRTMRRSPSRSVRLPRPETSPETSAFPGGRADRQRPVRDCDRPCAAGSRRASPVPRPACRTGIPGRLDDRVGPAPDGCAESSEGVAQRQPDAVALQPRLRRRQIERQRLPAPVAPDNPARSANVPAPVTTPAGRAFPLKSGCRGGGRRSPRSPPLPLPPPGLPRSRPPRV